MVECPVCGNNVEKPSRVAKENGVDIEVYECKKCKRTFNLTSKESSYDRELHRSGY